MRPLQYWPLVACALFAGCAVDPKIPGANVRPDLTGTTWVLDAIGEDLVVLQPGQKAPYLVLKENESRVFAFGGINRFSGSYRLEGDRLTFGPLASTRMAGPPADNAREDAFASALARTNRFQIKGDTLVLLNDSLPLLKLKATP